MFEIRGAKHHQQDFCFSMSLAVHIRDFAMRVTAPPFLSSEDLSIQMNEGCNERSSCVDIGLGTKSPLMYNRPFRKAKIAWSCEAECEFARTESEIWGKGEMISIWLLDLEMDDEARMRFAWGSDARS